MTVPRAMRGGVRWVERLAAVLVLGFLVLYLVRNGRELAAHDWEIAWGRLALSAVGLAVVYSGYVVAWRAILGALGGRLSLADAHRVWYLSNLARYVPGKVLQLAGTAWLVRAKGVSPVLGVASALLSQAFVLATGLVVALLALPEAGNAPPALYAAGVVAAAGIVLALLTPAFGPLFRLALRWTGHEVHARTIPWSARALLVVLYLALWVGMGGSFWLFLRSVAPIEADALWAVLGIHAAAYVAGFLAVFAPGGLGVREGVYAVLLALYIPPTFAVAAAILARLWSTAVELAVAGALVALYGVADLRVAADPPAGSDHG